MSSFRAFAKTDIGLVREGNEDSALISSRLIAVADGMGGHAAGEIASRIAIQTLRNLSDVLNDRQLDSESREDLLMNITTSVDDQIAEHAKHNPDSAGMGTTLTALHLGNDSVEMLHVGDSRCYQWVGEELVQLSVDHTVMQELMSQGRLTAEEVANHPQRSLLTQALVGDSGIDPVLIVFPAKVGDIFLLCSDGLSSVLSVEEMNSIVIKNRTDGQAIVDELVKQTKAKGAPDNITVIWAEVVAVEPTADLVMIGAAK